MCHSWLYHIHAKKGHCFFIAFVAQETVNLISFHGNTFRVEFSRYFPLKTKHEIRKPVNSVLVQKLVIRNI